MDFFPAGRKKEECKDFKISVDPSCREIDLSCKICHIKSSSSNKKYYLTAKRFFKTSILPSVNKNYMSSLNKTSRYKIERENYFRFNGKLANQK